MYPKQILCIQYNSKQKKDKHVDLNWKIHKNSKPYIQKLKYGILALI